MATLINANEALEACRSLEFSSVLDIGSGEGLHAAFFRDLGKEVYTCDLKQGADYKGMYNSIQMDRQFDLIWCSHTLEHQVNVYSFLKKIGKDLKEDGYLVITVPPMKNEIVGGHISVWNAGLLLYNLILAGFDCSKARVKSYGYNVSVIVKYKPITLPKIKMDFGDIETLSNYFPMEVKNGFNGDIKELNWK